MTRSSLQLAQRLSQASAVTLLAGLGLSLFLYLHAYKSHDLSMVEEFRNSKAFRHELEAYGGKMSVLGSQLNTWFAGLWEGKQLGLTTACITLALSFGLFLAARHQRRSA